MARHSACEWDAQGMKAQLQYVDSELHCYEILQRVRELYVSADRSTRMVGWGDQS